MKRLSLFFLILIFISSLLFAFTDAQIELTHNQEFALYQRLQLDTVIARMNSNNRIILSELELRDLVPSMNASNQNYYMAFNDNLGALKLVDTQRERLEFLHEEKQKSTLTALVPNALSVATVAITTGLRNPLGAIIGVVGTAVSSVSNYMDAKNQANLELIQQQWELDDQEEATLLELGNGTYEYKCQIATALNIPTELTLSTEDLEAFVNFCNEPEAETRYIKLLNLDKRLEILPDYWMELALTTYELGDYETTLSYISKFEEIYYPVIYHDSDYAHLLMVKSDCINQLPVEAKYQELEEIGDLLLSHIGAEDWQGRFYAMSLYMEIYRATDDIDVLEKAYALYPGVLVEIGDEYEADLASYLNREYITEGLAEIDTDIESAEAAVNTATSNLSDAKDRKYDKKGSAYKSIEKRLSDAELKLDELKDYRKEFERTASLMLPPSSSFLSSVMEQYISISETLGKTSEPEFQTICSYFARTISQSASSFKRYPELFASVTVPFGDVSYRYERKGGFLGIGRTHSMIFEIPLWLLDVSPEGSEKLIDADDIELALSIDGANEYIFKIDRISIETGDTLNTSYLILAVQNLGKYEVNMQKPGKDSGYTHTLKVTVSASESFFEPVSFSINPDSEMFKEIERRIKYSKEK